MWLEKQTFKWVFPDAKNPQAKVEVTLPCKEMYDGAKSCKIVNELRPLYKTGNDSDAEIARPFWPKKVYIFQGFVRDSAIQEKSVPENPIRIFMINKKVYTKIKESIMSNNPQTAFKISPDDYEHGRDFVIIKTKQGKYDNYDQSQWAFSESALTDHERAAIEKYGLWDLSTRLPKRPSDEAFEVMYEMFQAAMSGSPWDPTWEKHFKPRTSSGNRHDDDDDSSVVEHNTPVATHKPAVVATDAVSRLRANPPPVAKAPVIEHEEKEETFEAVAQPATPVVQQAPAENGKAILDRLKSLRSKSAPAG
jgi:hypothetical protein